MTIVWKRENVEKQTRKTTLKKKLSKQNTLMLMHRWTLTLQILRETKIQVNAIGISNIHVKMMVSLVQN